MDHGGILSVCMMWIEHLHLSRKDVPFPGKMSPCKSDQLYSVAHCGSLWTRGSHLFSVWLGAERSHPSALQCRRASVRTASRTCSSGNGFANVCGVNLLACVRAS